jgi:hypothetical protein
MKHQVSIALALLTSVFAFSGSCLADSDGYFCASNGYLAYEVRGGITPGVIGHVLKVVRFDSHDGIRSAGVVSMPDFEVHTMTCDQQRIELSGYGTVRSGNPPLTKCVVETGDSRQAISRAECNEDPAVQYDWRNQGPEPGNLGQWARTKSIPLESPDTEHNYLLLPQLSRRNVGGNRWELHCRTKIVQTDAQGKTSREFVVYETRIVAVDSGD